MHVYHSGPEQHPGFGELSLMYDKPRAASVIAITDGKLWALDRVTFKAVVVRSMNTRKGIIRTLRKVKILECLNFQQMQRLADILVEETFDEGTLTHSLTYLLTYSLTHSLTHSLTYLLTHSLTYSLTHSLTHLLTHLLTYSCT